jgi:Ca2+-binding EF-hand superfamily protein
MKVFSPVIPMAALVGALISAPAFADDNTEAFQKLDLDNDGYISEHEALAHSELPEAFEDADENSDGRLDLAEFNKLEILED